MLLESHHAALLYDGAYLLSEAIEQLSNQTDIETPTVSCQDNEAPYEMGEQLLETLKQVKRILKLLILE